MITIGYSTRKPNPQFSEYLKNSCGIKSIQVIEKVNPDGKSLTQVYNEILDESHNDIVVLCHDDIYFDTTYWGNKLLKHFEKNEWGILGAAGTTELPKSGMWWEDMTKMVGIVNHENSGNKWTSNYSEDLKNKIKRTVMVDGLFIAINKKRILKRFDENVNGFHFYDVTFSLQNNLENVNIGVFFNIRITHKSIGQTNQQWEENRKNFEGKYSDVLPLSVKVNDKDNLKVLFIADDLYDQNSFYLNQNLPKNFEVSILCSNFNKDVKKKCNKLGYDIFTKNNIPGFILGDGKRILQSPNGKITSEEGKYYKTSNVNFDVVLSNSLQLFDIVAGLYSSPKVFLNEEVSLLDNILGGINKIENLVI